MIACFYWTFFLFITSMTLGFMRFRVMSLLNVKMNRSLNGTEPFFFSKQLFGKVLLISKPKGKIWEGELLKMNILVKRKIFLSEKLIYKLFWWSQAKGKSINKLIFHPINYRVLEEIYTENFPWWNSKAKSRVPKSVL